ncbi:RNA polymerase sigma-70 factor (family 1) [Catalinimonas alkaloidigena]|uniref:RNA polymerase sigma factor n=1 Tax=Catalinimonas alkaloidigena TaxID=1075417 RepID=UPI002404FADF|nr:RNA polymerase sigma-70 factor [Catalinimonas alkaloidigena]MDF9796945.1 RNA polymerase sigma-70 factor (family 1) [Catalinimonas alkaloidigena]
MEEFEISLLVKKIAKGDSAAFKLFFDKLYPRMYRLAFFYVKSDVLSEELVSDIFLKVWNNRKKLPEVKKLDFYLYQAVKNQSLTYLKKESQLSTIDLPALKSMRIEYSEPESIMIARELAVKIESAISELPDKCEMIFRLVREEEMSYKEVAELMDISSKTVENQMSIAIKKLKATLDAYQNSTSDSSHISLMFLLLLLDILSRSN